MFDAELVGHREGVALVDLGVRVEAVALNASHQFAKTPAPAIRLREGLGVEGDAHCGATDQHMFRNRADAPPNLRQLHLFAAEMADLLLAEGFAMAPGAIGENIMTRGVNLTDLPLHTVLRFGSGAVARLTGRRAPCRLVDRLGPGLLKRLGGPKGALWGEGALAGVMAVVVRGGDVAVGDPVRISRPAQPHVRLPPI